MHCGSGTYLGRKRAVSLFDTLTFGGCHLREASLPPTSGTRTVGTQRKTASQNNLETADSSKLHPMDSDHAQQEGGERVKVFCRFRPESDREGALQMRGVKVSLEHCDNTVKVLYHSVFQNKTIETQSFSFDRVLRNIDQETAYGELAQDTTQSVLQGYNGAIIAYGQTGSGKSYSIFGELGNPTLHGMIPRASREIFSSIANAKNQDTIKVSCSLLEIRNEVLHDLLNPAGQSLHIREDSGRVVVDNLSFHEVHSDGDVIKLIENAFKLKRLTNNCVARAHTLCWITVQRRSLDRSTIQESVFTFVDLACSESARELPPSQKTMEEKTNKSLDALGDCIHALTSGDGDNHFNDSTLTLLLKESLSGNCKTSVVLTCSPHSSKVEATVACFRFGQRLKSIHTRARINEELDDEYASVVVNNLKQELDMANKTIQWVLEHSGDGKAMEEFKKSGMIPKIPRSSSEPAQGRKRPPPAKKPAVPPRSLKPAVRAPLSRRSFGESMASDDFNAFVSRLPSVLPGEMDQYVKENTQLYLFSCHQLETAVHMLSQAEQKIVLTQLMASRINDLHNYSSIFPEPENKELQDILSRRYKRQSLLLTTGDEYAMKMKTRQLVMKEIVTSEEDYLLDLNTIVELYIKPLERQSILTKEEITGIFSNITVLLGLNTEVLTKYRLNNNISDFFLRMVQVLKSYTEYCVNQIQSLEILEACRTKNSKFEQFLKKAAAEPRSQKLNLFAFLIKPVQRLCKYPLLIRELINNTPQNHPEHGQLVMYASLINSVVDSVNERKRDAENKKKLMELWNSIEFSNPNFNLVTPSRKFVKEETLLSVEKGKKKMRKLMMFNDLILWANVNGKKHRFKGQIPLDGLCVVDLGDTEDFQHGWELSNKQNKSILIQFCASSAASKREWVETIKMHLKDYQKKQFIQQSHITAKVQQKLVPPRPRLMSIPDSSCLTDSPLSIPKRSASATDMMKQSKSAIVMPTSISPKIGATRIPPPPLPSPPPQVNDEATSSPTQVLWKGKLRTPSPSPSRVIAIPQDKQRAETHPLAPVPAQVSDPLRHRSGSDTALSSSPVRRSHYAHQIYPPGKQMSVKEFIKEEVYTIPEEIEEDPARYR